MEAMGANTLWVEVAVVRHVTEQTLVLAVQVRAAY
jgi:hypothetical protein